MGQAKDFWIATILHGIDIANVAFTWEACYKVY